MRQHLGKLIPVCLASGCSLLYNPDRIDKPLDAKQYLDAAIDADPSALTLTGVESPPLLEGQGDGGSRPAVLVVRGMNIVGGATVTIAPTAGTAMIEVVDPPVVSTQSDLIAVGVIARVDPALAAGQTQDLVVTVSQPTATGMVQQTTTWQLQGLDELEPMGAGNATLTTTGSPFVYSRVNVAGTLTLSGTEKAIIRATSSISIKAIAGLSASGQNPGPGGGAGGAGGNTASDGIGPGRGKKGVPGTSGGGGAGFLISGEDGGGNPTSGGAQTGDALITSYATNAGSGGGGSNYPGGGGGGTLELTAGGNLTVGHIESRGGDGGSGGVALTAGGGGGAGGCVVLRAGAAATVDGFDLRGGAAGSGTLAGSDGGAGRAGRARVDAVSITGDMGLAHRGLAFDATAPVIVRAATPTAKVLGSNNDKFDLQRASTSFAPLGGKQMIDFGGATDLEPGLPALEPGFNRVCAVPEGSGLGNPESRNCIDLAYLP
jgi:hypothetical protein